MCGITGHYALQKMPSNARGLLEESLNALSRRGPNANGQFLDEDIALGHSRLSIIDLSSGANQPMDSNCGRYSLVFNGEIFNFKELANDLKIKGCSFRTQSDTEVLLNLLCEYGADALNKLNGFFAFAFYDKKEKSLLLARDRFGIKPLLYSANYNGVSFASELKAIVPWLNKLEIDPISTSLFFQLTYIPAPHSIFKNVEKLLPGHFLKVGKNGIKIERYYTTLENLNEVYSKSYEDAQQEFLSILQQSIKRRLISDAPLGAFLSGGIDSSAVVALASKEKPDLKTFSIGFPDNPFHDESQYALDVVRKFKTNHTTIPIRDHDILSNIDDILDYLDEPFGDSSAIAVYILSKKVKEHVTVALSGDGADELFAGYNKYRAEIIVSNNSRLLKPLSPFSMFLSKLPMGRENMIGNLVRQANRFLNGASLGEAERYMFWCRFNSENKVRGILSNDFLRSIDPKEYSIRTSQLYHPAHFKNFNKTLFSDLNLVLPNDMLTKVDMMSMANSLEVRVPFLDHNLVEFAMKLPPEYKINKSSKKRIVQDSFKDILPKSLYNRPKQGFSIPLMKWFSGPLNQRIEEEWLFGDLAHIFNDQSLQSLKCRIRNNMDNDNQALIWGLIVFSSFLKKFKHKIQF